MSVAIRLDKLQIGYLEQKEFKTLLSDISLQFSLGELIAVVGANGTGKSTLLHTIAGLRERKGEIYLFDKKIESYNTQEFSKKQSYISTQYQVQAYTSVFDLIAKGRTAYLPWSGKLREKDKDIITKEAKRLGIEHLLNRDFNTLSDGEKQRSLIAMALVQDTPIMLLDEPTAYIDFPNKYLISSLLQDISHQQKKCILFSSHDIEVVLSFADKILLLGENEISLILPKDLLLKENLKKLYHKTEIPLYLENLIHNQLKNIYPYKK